MAFPSQRKLVARYRVTRTTVRSAIGVVKQEGMVVAEHGAGSFVRDPNADRHRVDATRVGMMHPAPPRQDPEDRAPAHCFRLSAILESAERRMKTTPWISELLEVEGGTEVPVQEARLCAYVYSRRVAHGLPVILDEAPAVPIAGMA